MTEMTDKATDVALWRYALVREAVDQGLSKAKRGRLVRAIAETTHAGPFGEPVGVSRPTIDRWIRELRRGGFEALRPRPRQVLARTPADLIELAEILRKEEPTRTAAHIAELIASARGYSPSARTLQRHLRDRGLARASLCSPSVVHGRFEASAPNELWVGDALHGPMIDGRKAILFCYLDDHSRLATGYRFVRSEDTLRAEDALRRAITSRGVPKVLYLDYADPRIMPTFSRRSCSWW